ncbi:MAG TPA: hypothetical protein VFQ77_14180 [Pseudonocardiaceae bacterium]|nr:hypothetical protein [Pseudonocardiaceae bacterium]
MGLQHVQRLPGGVLRADQQGHRHRGLGLLGDQLGRGDVEAHRVEQQPVQLGDGSGVALLPRAGQRGLGGEEGAGEAGQAAQRAGFAELGALAPVLDPGAEPAFEDLGEPVR